MENILQEAFKRLSLLEDDFNMADMDRDKVDELKAFVADDVDMPEEEEVIDVIDPDAKDASELEDIYTGKVILECACCHSRIYKNKDDVIIEDDLANVDEPCPVCGNEMGFTVIGKIEAYDKDRNIEAEAEEEDEPEEAEYEKTEDDIEDEEAFPADDIEDEEEKDESLKESINRNEIDSLAKKYYSEYNLPDGYYDGFKDWACIQRAIGDLLGLPNEDKRNNIRQIFDYIRNTAEVIGEDDGGDPIYVWPKKEGFYNHFKRKFDKEIIDALYAYFQWPTEGYPGESNESLKNHPLASEDSKKLDEGVDKDKMKTDGKLPKDFPKGEPDEEDLPDPWGKDSAEESLSIKESINRNEVDELIKKYDAKYANDSYVIRQARHQDHIEYAIADVLGLPENKRENVGQIRDYINWLGKDYDQYDQEGWGAPAKVNILNHFKRKFDKEIIDALYDYFQWPEEGEEPSFGESLKNHPLASEDSKKLDEEDEVCPKCGKKPCECKKEDLDESVEINASGEDEVHINKNDDGSMNVQFGAGTAEGFGEEDFGEEPSEEVGEIVPLDAEDEADIEDNKSENEESEEESSEEDIDDFDEESFDEMGESFITRTYSNVDSYKTTSVKDAGNKFIIEGVITYKSGKKRNTQFVFENASYTKRGKLMMEGYNDTFTKSKKAFTLRGTLSNGNYVSEDFKYDYTVKQLNESNQQETVRVFGRVKAR